MEQFGLLPSPLPHKKLGCVSDSRSVVFDSLRPPWILACQAPLSMEPSKQEYWSELSFPSPGDLPDGGVEPTSPTLQVDSLLSEPPGEPEEVLGKP